MAKRDAAAADDVMDSTALSTGTVPPPDDGFESDEERAQFEEMRANAALDNNGGAEVDDGAGGDAAAGDAGAGDAAAAAAKAGEQQRGDEADDDDDDVDPTQGGQFPQRVSYHKFKRTRERMQTAETAARDAQDKLARTDERMKMLVEAMMGGQKQGGQQAGAQSAEGDLGEMPDPEKDIFGAFKWAVSKIGQLDKTLAETRSGVQARDDDQSLVSAYQRDIAQFNKSTPDFGDAYQYMMLTRTAELAWQYFGLDLFEQGAQLTKQQLDRIAPVVEREEKQLAALALQAGRSPAQQLYGMARARGYRKAPAAQTNGTGKGNGQAQQGNGAAGGQTRSKISDAIATAKRGVQTNQSLSTGGGAPEAELTSAQVFAMNDDQFATFMETASPDQLKAIFGA